MNQKELLRKKKIMLYLHWQYPFRFFRKTGRTSRGLRTHTSPEKDGGETVDEADKQALADLISKISIIVSSDYESIEGEERTNGSDEYKHYVESKVRTFSSATLTNTGSVILHNEPDAHVGRWIKKSEISRIFEARKGKILEYISNAVAAERKCKLDDALRN